jgi:ABC-type dipeptide/oligopeptide/nickel transport system ATPase component
MSRPLSDDRRATDRPEGLRHDFGLTILLITHNIGVVAEVADRVAVMYAGKMAEIGSVFDVFGAPKHPYTQVCFTLSPISLMEYEFHVDGFHPICSGPSGCRFHCAVLVMDICRHKSLEPAGDGISTACWLYQEVADCQRQAVLDQTKKIEMQTPDRTVPPRMGCWYELIT